MKEEHSLTSKIIGYSVAATIGGLTFLWYNHICFKTVVPVWQWYILALIYIFCVINTDLIKLMKFIASFMFLCACIIQTLCWFKVITLPLIK